MTLALPAAAAKLALATSTKARSGEDAVAQLARIAAINDTGPQINAITVMLDPDQASARAGAAKAAGLPLARRTVLVKHNIETREWPTTAGSLALKDNATGRDAPEPPLAGGPVQAMGSAPRFGQSQQ